MASVRQHWPRATEEKNEIFLAALKRAYEAGFCEGVRLPNFGEDSDIPEIVRFNMDKVDFWTFDARVEKEPKLKKTSSAKKPKKVTPKKPTLSNDLASAEFNPECCRARFWNQKDKGDVPVDQPGHGMQCWRAPDPAFEGGYCEKCFNLKTEPDQRTSTTHWFGDFDKPLCESPGEKKDGTALQDWPAMRKLKPKKEKKTLEKKEKKKKPKKDKKEKKVKKGKKEKKEPEVEVKIEDIENQGGFLVAPEADIENPGGFMVADKAAAIEEPVLEADKAEMANEEDQEILDAVSAQEIKVEGEDEEKTQELSDDELGEDTQTDMIEYEHDGFTLLWNKKTNELIDPDDSEVMGTMVADDEGNWKPQMTENGSEEEDSDSEDEDE